MIFTIPKAFILARISFPILLSTYIFRNFQQFDGVAIKKYYLFNH